MKEVTIYNKSIEQVRTILTYELCIETMLLIGYQVSFNFDSGTTKLENKYYTITWKNN
ncbi:MAG: hypothetical protein ACRC5T_03175 [Cetobacterium sp.]